MPPSTKKSRYTPAKIIQVSIWGQLVGAVALDPIYAYYVFSYAEKFRQSSIELSPLQMPLKSTSEPVMFSDLPEATYKRLPAMLADALPDDFGSALVDRFMAERGISSSQISALDRLAYMGSRSMGAMEFKPQHGPRKMSSSAIVLSSLVQEARNVVSGTFGDDDHTKAALRSIIEVGTSAGGARAKAVIAWNPDSQEIRSGHANVDLGFTHWLLKFDGVGKDKEFSSSMGYGRIEYAYYLMAKAAGVAMTECRLLEENGRAHFMTRRFDREENNVRHHLQTLCAMAHVDYKKKATNSYAQFFMTIRDLGLARESMVQAFRRMVFNLMARNCDDHSKNFSFLLKQGSQWELSPAYDMTFSYNPHSEWVSQHLMSVNGKFRDFELQDILVEADRFGIGEIRSIILDAQSAISRWREFSAIAGVSQDDVLSIEKLFWFPI
ncbi:MULTISPECIES: type II toxin-antitoxin system HipA family toxin [unclassified Undibacterium]|uniref:type II toxin-antitoxin system HipA family toxin n=1 Tax=unclassified Undibacterium TaxID=2630295 RepID=UPI002AC9B849|nr:MULTISPECIES: type II toxin-antitoxin system HipA family toxin [unclassified Undibacterium]MEB0140131.1 type II toxin-antitoxin system HipA family toxin [Undibacterium sp. CCC2.1]MEB0173601.1 type II toxin-antitoxin system HipA family toxin [Undibacterium sp. CCC1.1]MEB0177542.1 type II toxin-antitoxin system HipA family toxin [Undibacterium sp. CCC3.4]MEB0214454.1 type II toxin-antitoxin system HipA family toxin [Undibacterium sp. 5I2]WPX42851.1 type II toxin-antitoxin system HipA family t